MVRLVKVATEKQKSVDFTTQFKWNDRFSTAKKNRIE